MEGFKAIVGCMSGSPEERVAVSAAPVETKDGPGIRFRLTNISNDPLRIYPFDLPWGNLGAAEYAAVTVGGKVLPTIWPIDDPWAEKPVSIAPGESLTGEVPLKYRITGLEAANRTTDVVVNWCYPFRQPEERNGGGVSGVVVLPKRAV